MTKEEFLVTAEEYERHEETKREALEAAAKEGKAPISFWKAKERAIVAEAAKSDAAKIKEGKIYARHLEKEKEEADIEWRQAERAARGIAEAGIKVTEAVGMTILKGIGHIARIKGIRHPDDTIDPRARHLYLPGNPQVTPLGYKPTVQELYFGGRSRLGGIHGGVAAREKIEEFGDYQATLRKKFRGHKSKTKAPGMKRIRR